MSGELPPPLFFSPPVLNSASPWATTLEDLQTLFTCPHTGAVTTRTCLLNGFPHDPSVHQYTFFDPHSHSATAAASIPSSSSHSPSSSLPRPPENHHSASLNTLGYSPIPLDEYLSHIRAISLSDTAAAAAAAAPRKPFVVSVTGSPDEVAECYRRIARCGAAMERARGSSGPAPASVSDSDPAPALAMELNLSCPNIPGKSPPAYDGAALAPYLAAVRDAAVAAEAELAGGTDDGGGGGGGGGGGPVRLPWGLKTPPYTHAAQFETLVAALRAAAATDGGPCPASFLTATNTLGSCLVLEEDGDDDGGGGGAGAGTGRPKLGADGMGGMAGAPLHPLALGNVRTLRRLLDAHPATRHVDIIGVGGVDGPSAYRRMRGAGAAFVGVGTALGRKGVDVFREIGEGVH